jgi:kanamycin kinase
LNTPPVEFVLEEKPCADSIEQFVSLIFTCLGFRDIGLYAWGGLMMLTPITINIDEYPAQLHQLLSGALMMLTPITINIDEYPAQLHQLLSGAKLYDSSCSPEARVIYIDKGPGFFLKSSARGMLAREAAMTHYFYEIGLSCDVITYISDEHDWMVTEKLPGCDATDEKYLSQPERLCDIIAKRLARLHSEKFSGCPVQNHTERYLALAEQNKRAGTFDKSHFPDSFGYASAEEAWAVVESRGHLLKTDTLLHGDYCLPNIILDDWRFSGFIDLGNGGVGDRHVDIFWGIWSLWFNLKTDKYRERFIDAYGRDKVDEEMLRVVAAAEVFR